MIAFVITDPANSTETRMIAHSPKETIIVSYTSLRITEPSDKAQSVEDFASKRNEMFPKSTWK